jgi:signal transduction histidine kinase
VLTLLILRLQGLARKHRHEPLADEVRDAVAAASDASEELRAISSGLVLPELEPLEIDDVIMLAIDRHRRLTGLVTPARLENLPAGTTTAVKACLYRMVQESLMNAFRHSGARPATVSADRADNNIVVQVTNALESSTRVGSLDESLGLRGMRFRVESLGGELKLDFQGGHAMVVAVIPFA